VLLFVPSIVFGIINRLFSVFIIVELLPLGRVINDVRPINGFVIVLLSSLGLPKVIHSSLATAFGLLGINGLFQVTGLIIYLESSSEGAVSGFLAILRGSTELPLLRFQNILHVFLLLL